MSLGLYMHGEGSVTHFIAVVWTRARKISEVSLCVYMLENVIGMLSTVHFFPPCSRNIRIRVLANLRDWLEVFTESKIDDDDGGEEHVCLEKLAGFRVLEVSVFRCVMKRAIETVWQRQQIELG